MNTWIGKKTKNKLERKERGNIYLTHVGRLPLSLESSENRLKTGAFSQHYDFHQLVQLLQLMKATVLAESSSCLSVLWIFYILQQSADMIQVGVAPFFPFFTYLLS